MDKPPTASPHAPGNDLDLVMDLAKRHGKPLAAGLGVGIALLVGLTAYRGCGEKATERASMMLASARTLHDLDTLLGDYPSTPAAPLALLRLAKGYYDGGNYNLAMEKYSEFERKYPDHPMVRGAALGKIHCVEARGQWREAEAGFRAFAQDHPDHFLTPLALFGRARCLEAMNRFDEARVVYEDFIASRPDSPWTPRAEEAMAAARKKSRRRPEAASPGGPSGAPPPVDALLPLSFTNISIAPIALPDDAAPTE